MKGIIIYKGKYGATRQYANWLGSIFGLPVVEAGAETPEQLAEADSTKKNQNENRKEFSDWLAANIKIEGIIEITRDTDFDDKNYRSGGIRLKYKTFFDPIEGIKEGVLLEAGFAKVTPNFSY